MSPLLLLAACSTLPASDSQPADTAALDTAVELREPTAYESVTAAATQDCEEPGFCGCGWTGYDLDGELGDETCIHDGANVDESVVFQAGVMIHDRAVVEAGAQIATGAVIGVAAHVGSTATIGADSWLARRSRVGAGTYLGANSSLGRNAVIGNTVQAFPGGLTLGYGATLGDSVRVLGTGVVVGNLVTVDDGATLGANTTIARNTYVGPDALLGEGVIIGPDCFIGEACELGDGVRIRKNTVVGDGSALGDGTRIGRDNTIEDDVSIGTNGVLRADVYVGSGNDLPNDVYVPRGTRYEPLAIAPDAPPTVLITSPAVGDDRSGSSLRITGEVSDDAGLSSVVVRIDNGPATPLELTDGAFDTVVNIPPGANSLRVIATDTAGQVSSASVGLASCDASPYDTEWTGAVDNSFDDPANWTAGVPNAGTSGYICGDVTTIPRLGVATNVGTLGMSGHAQLDSFAVDLLVGGDFLGGTVIGSGTVELLGSGSARGQAYNLRVSGDYALAGELRSQQDTTLVPGGSLSIGAHALDIGDDLIQTIGGAGEGLLIDGTGYVQVWDDASFTANSPMSGSLTSGELRLAGNLSFTSSGARPDFYSEGTRTVFNGSVEQYLTLSSVFLEGSDDQFADVVVQNSDAIVRVSSGDLLVTGDLILEDGAHLNSKSAIVQGDYLLRGASTHTVGDSVSGLHVDGEVIANPSATLAPNDVYVSHSLPNLRGATLIDPGLLLPVGQMVHTGDYTNRFDGMLLMDGSSLTVSDGTLDAGTNTILFTSNPATDGLRLVDGATFATDDFVISGNAVMPSEHLDSGQLIVRNSFGIDDYQGVGAFRPGSTLLVLGDPANPGQSVNFSISDQNTGNSFYNNVEVVGAATHGGTSNIHGNLTVLEGASVRADTLNVGGHTDLRAGASLTAFSEFNSTGSFSGHASSTLTAPLVTVSSEVLRSAGTVDVDTLRIDGNIALTDDYTLATAAVDIPSGSSLDVGPHHFELLAGDFSQTVGDGTDGLLLSSNSTAIIGGNATFEAIGDLSPSAMTGGEFHFRRNLSASESVHTALAPGGTTFFFDGAGTQQVNLGNTVRNSLGDVVVSSSTSTQFRNVSGGGFNVQDLTVNTRVIQYVDTVVNGDLVVDGTADIQHAGYTLTVHGSCAGIAGAVNPGANCQ